MYSESTQNKIEDRLISIILVVFNAQDTIKKTLDSLFLQSYANWELVVVDGMSTDSTLDIVQSYNFQNIHLYKGYDCGIYDAMNRGVSLSSGQWLFFLNSGDEFADSKVLSIIAEYVLTDFAVADIVYGDVSIIGPNRKSKAKHQLVRNTCDFVFKIPICHQTAFIQRRCFAGNYYDVNYPVCADYDFFFNIFNKQATFLKIPILVSKYLAGGYSHRRLIHLQVERMKIVMHHAPTIYALAFIPFWLLIFAKTMVIAFASLLKRNQ